MKAVELLEAPFLNGGQGLETFKLGGLQGVDNNLFRHGDFFRLMREGEKEYLRSENGRRADSRKKNDRHYGIVLRKRYVRILDRRKSKTQDLYNEMFAACEHDKDRKVLNSLFQVLKAIEDYAADYTNKKKHVTLTKDYVFVAPVTEINNKVRKGRWMTNIYMRLLSLLGIVTRVSHETWGRDPYIGELGIREQHYRLDTIKIREIVARWQTWINSDTRITKLDYHRALEIFGARRVAATYHTPEAVLPVDEDGNAIADSPEALLRKANLEKRENPDYWQNDVWIGQKGKCRALIRLAFSRLEEAKKYLRNHGSWYDLSTHQRFTIPCNERVGIIRVQRNRLVLNLDEILNLFKMLTIARRCIVNNWAESVFTGICRSESWWNNESREKTFKVDLVSLYHKMTLVAPELFRTRPEYNENYGDIRHDVFGTVIPKEDPTAFSPFFAPLRRFELDSYDIRDSLPARENSSPVMSERPRGSFTNLDALLYCLRTGDSAGAESILGRLREITGGNDSMEDEEHPEENKSAVSTRGTRATYDDLFHMLGPEAVEEQFQAQLKAFSASCKEELERAKEDETVTDEEFFHTLGIRPDERPSIAEGIAAIIKKDQDLQEDDPDVHEYSYDRPEFKELYDMTFVQASLLSDDLSDQDREEFSRVRRVVAWFCNCCDCFARQTVARIVNESGCTLKKAYHECLCWYSEIKEDYDLGDPIFQRDAEKLMSQIERDLNQR